jgi:MFS family permease
MSADDMAPRGAKRNPIWIVLAILLMIVCAYCVGEWRLVGRLAAGMAFRSDLTEFARNMSMRSHRFEVDALILFPVLVILLGATDPRAKNGGADRLRGYILGFVFAVLGTAAFLIIETFLFWMLIRNMHLQ